MSRASVSCPPQCAETDHNKNTDDINPETVQNTITNYSQVEEEWQRDLLKGLLTDNFCHVCEATLLYESQRVSHYEGKKHAQRVRLYLQNKKAEKYKQSQECRGSLRGLSADPEKFCELCNMVFSSPTVARSHYEGKVHAKNMRKTNPPPYENTTPIVGSTSPGVLPTEATVQNPIGQEQKDSSGSPDQEVNVNDPNKYCTLCKSSFNNPVVAQQHYSGRKHQRNQTRQQMLDQFGDQSEHVSTLTCPICCMVFSSIEMYQAHMQGNKHHIKEKKVMELCQSQKKVYDSYQDELADYIQVQKARGLDPRAVPGTVGQTSKSLNEIVESPLAGEAMPHPTLIPQRPPPAGFHQPHWHPPFQSQVNDFGFRMRGPVPLYHGGYMPHPTHSFIPGKIFKRERSPDSHNSSSFSDSSSSYTSSSSSDSSSSYEKRRQKRKMRRQRRKRRYQEDECDTDRRGREEEGERGERKRKSKEDRRGSVEGEEDRVSRKWKERRKKERSSSEDEEGRSRRKPSKKSRRHGDAHHAKRRKEEELMGTGEEEVQNKEAQGKTDECVNERTDKTDVKQKHKKEKKKGKEKGNQEDNRTEEERLWDETILGVF